MPRIYLVSHGFLLRVTPDLDKQEASQYEALSHCWGDYVDSPQPLSTVDAFRCPPVWKVSTPAPSLLEVGPAYAVMDVYQAALGGMLIRGSWRSR